MYTDTRERILNFVAKHERVTAKAIIEHVGLTPPAVFRQLGRLLESGALKKQGRPPVVFYSIAQIAPVRKIATFISEAEQLITERFLKIGSDGTLRQGVPAFIDWCLARGTDPVRASMDYVASIRKFDAFKKEGLIDGMRKLKKTFPDTHLDELLYLDFYSIERFGKTKLGELLLYAKQSQNRELIRTVVTEIRPRILELLRTRNIQAVGFIPPTVKRTVQFMHELQSQLNLPVRHLKITKIKTPIIVPQKTLTKLQERTENVRQSIVVEEMEPAQNILLIDDAVGSGATINEVARQIHRKSLCTGTLTGLAITGSFNGFDVIQEV